MRSAGEARTDELFTSDLRMARMFGLVGAGSRPSEVFLSGIAGMLGPLAGGYAVSALLQLRVEGTSARVEPFLAGPVSRLRWATSHLVLALLGPAVALGAAGLAGGLVYGFSTGDVGRELPRVLVGALAQLPAVGVLAGLTFALFGLWPRTSWGGWTALGVHAHVGRGDVGTTGSAAARPVALQPGPPLPVGPVSVAPILWLLANTPALVGAGLLGLRRRDVASA
jgi:ABC-2 type transport system permease protein